MTTLYQQPGHVWQYTATANITAGQVVVMGAVLAVALTDIANGETGSVSTKGVFELPKVTGAVFAQGDKLTWDVSAGKFDDGQATPATGDITGAASVAFKAGANGETTAQVLLTGVPGTVN